jgi:PIN domain nuclease of toxin-antitoxin system
VAPVIRLDTHVVVWLFAGEVERLSTRARELLEAEIPVISPIVELELAFLYEIDRITVRAVEIIADLGERIGLATSAAPMHSVAAAATPLHWTRDPFDRLIVGDALASSASLITKDVALRERSGCAVW